MPDCEICDDVVDDDDVICDPCEHGGDRPHLVERGDGAAREQKMRFFSQYGD